MNILQTTCTISRDPPGAAYQGTSGSMSSKLFHKISRNLRNVVFWKSPREVPLCGGVFGRSLGTAEFFWMRGTHCCRDEALGWSPINMAANQRAVLIGLTVSLDGTTMSEVSLGAR
ncbi:hypothetical protein EYF80_019251 [Liparis tanakae]|uniref:Uncharacterized protein n=1 Tax=Liparis tanakae TaxID=230148 RepID=A0A4Z2HXB8_9TELE|nr:hypothetical protein EYF80_019251 [Liparis tanakae]